MSGPAIEGIGISKRFRIPRSHSATLKSRVVHPFRRTSYDEFQALDDVDFRIEKGEFFGIVGRNGCGKSTLLKLIAGIYRADAGTLRIDGSIAPFIELGVGFNDELSGRENLFLNGALLGLSPAQLRDRYDAIVDFAELHEFMELKLRNFSSGMQVRLAFSIALQAGADILLTDEVLAVGDERFQRKCFDVFRAQKRSGQTVVFVSHDMGAVSQFCDRGLLLEQGRVRAYGPINEVVREYHRMNAGEDDATAEVAGPRVVDVRLESSDGERITSAAPEERCTIVVRVRTDDPLPSPFVSIGIRDRFGYLVFGTNTDVAGHDLGRLDRGEEREVRFSFANPFAAGRYYVSASIAWPTTGDTLHRKADACAFDVHSDDATAGVLHLPHEVTSSQLASTT